LHLPSHPVESAPSTNLKIWHHNWQMTSFTTKDGRRQKSMEGDGAGINGWEQLCHDYPTGSELIFSHSLFNCYFYA